MAAANTNIASKQPIRHTLRHVHGRVKHHYHKRMPNKKHHRVLIWVVFFSVVTVIAAQLLYPPNRALPLAQLSGASVFWQTEDELAFRVTEAFQSTNATFTAEDNAASQTLSRLGGSVQADATIQPMLEYPFWWRFVPGSILFFRQDVRNIEVTYDEATLQAASEAIAKELQREPQNAGIAVEDGRVVATDDVSGIRVQPESVTRVVRDATVAFDDTLSVQVPHETWLADTTADDLASIRGDAETALGRDVRILVGDDVVLPTQADRARWLEIVPDGSGAKLEFSRDRAEEYVAQLNKSYGKAAGTTTIHLVDGNEKDREAGVRGRAIKVDELIAALEQWVIGGAGDGFVQATFSSIAPKVTYTRAYTSSELGLQTYVNDAAAAQNANIVVQQLDGSRWAASDSSALSIPSASTYKLYVAWALFDKMNKGEVKWGDSVLDTTVSGCFDRMIIASTNPCADHWRSAWGVNYLNNFMWSRGISKGTVFGQGAARTTAGDLATLLRGLENCSTICGAQRDRLLEGMRTNPYRDGIVAGSAGTVWHKVGFLWDYVHDAAIVHHPKGKYIIVVMTNGRGYGTIADITRQAERIMYP